MLGNFSIIGAVAAIIMIPTALSAQMGGAVNPGVHVGGAVNPPFAAPSSEVSLARIWGLGAHRVGKFTAVVSILWGATNSAGDGVDRYGQTSLLVGHRSGAERRRVERGQA